MNKESGYVKSEVTTSDVLDLVAFATRHFFTDDDNKPVDVTEALNAVSALTCAASVIAIHFTDEKNGKSIMRQALKPAIYQGRKISGMIEAQATGLHS